MRNVWVSLLMLAAAAIPLAAAPAELCFLDTTRPDCRPLDARFAPAAHARPFAAWNADRTELTLGLVPPNARSIDLPGAEWRTLDLTLSGDDPGSWPQPVRLTLEPLLQYTIGAHAAVSLRRIRVQQKEGKLELEPLHHRPVVRDLRALGTIAFASYPRIAGTAVDAASGTPAAGASIILPTGSVLTTAAVDGRFAADITGEWPPFVRVELPHRAPRVVSLPRAVRSFDAGTVSLSPGGAIRLTVDRDVSADLFRVDGDDRIAALTRTLSEGTTELGPLEPGNYELQLRGAGPLQRDARRVRVVEGATAEVRAAIRPVTLVLRSVPGASIDIGPADGAWQASVQSGDSGVNELELWQQGEFAAFVKAGGASGFAHRRLAGVHEIEWTIELPEGRIDGIVLGDGKPVAGAMVDLETETQDESAQVRTTTDEQGRYVFRHVAPGRQTLTATAPGFTPAERSFALGKDPFTATLRLERALAQTVIVTLANGRPAANAVLLDAATGREIIAGADGSATLDLRAGEQKTLYVLPVEGSFAAVDIAAPRDAAAPLRVTVPPPDATIVVRARSREGAPIGGIFFAVRYNGRVLPGRLRLALRTQPDGAAVLRNMPAGFYEIWPYTSAAELQAIEWGLGKAPVQLAARAGENEVVLTFDREEKSK